MKIYIFSDTERPWELACDCGAITPEPIIACPACGKEIPEILPIEKAG